MLAFLLTGGLLSTLLLVNGDSGDDQSAPLTGETGSTSGPEVSDSADPPLVPASTTTSIVRSTDSNWNEIARSIVRIDASLDPNCPWSGSGTVIGDGSFILTSAHVAMTEFDVRPCLVTVEVLTDVDQEPDTFYVARAVAWDIAIDVAVLRVLDSNGAPVVIAESQPIAISERTPDLGERITTLSFPAQGGRTITLSAGEYSGMSDDSPPFYKTTAALDSGGSGGGAFLSDGSLVGILTAVTVPTGEEIDSMLGLIRPVALTRSLIQTAFASEVLPPETESSFTGGGGGEIASSSDPKFDSCREAKRNGYGPYYYGINEEYDWYQDRDSDGVVCE